MPSKANFGSIVANLWIRSALLIALLAGVIALFDRPLGPLPPLGPLLSPYQGIWIRPPSAIHKSARKQDLDIPGLKAPVTIQIDQDRVTHIFAANDDDLYLAQGWVVASERLWQMEFITRAASGRLSEILGKNALPIDRFFLRVGLPEAAKESSRLMMEDPVTSSALKSYVQGVNAFIATLRPATLPFEYKVLGQRPEAWTTQKAALLLKFMAYNLSGHSLDLPLTRSRLKLSQGDFEELFPLNLKVPEPIVPKGTKWSFTTRAPETKPEKEFRPDLRKLDPIPSPHPSNGSNNWAVTGKKSTTGLPILSNDIHLGLSLPALWYELQLVSPTQNVYGVTLPGAPGVILGFNQSLAWGVTNGGTDVLDWYELRFRDERKSEYLFDGDWRPVLSQEHFIHIKGELKPEVLITRNTHLGPIVYDESEVPLNALIPRGLAMRWGALDPSNELKNFLMLNRARTTKACREAIETFEAPDQNFLCADNTGDVGLWHMGKYPVRWPGQGRMIGDGSSSAYEWKGWLPREEVPFYRNPERGFLSSANQAPTDENYPHYLGWPFETPFRGMRINEVLKSKPKFSPEEIVRMQADKVSLPAKTVLPTLLKALSGDGTPSTDQARQVVEALAKWNYEFDENSPAATIFYVWYGTLVEEIWSAHLPISKDYMLPPANRTLEMITHEPEARWFDRPKTPQKETLRDLARVSFVKALRKLERETGDDDVEDWGWTKYRPTTFEHIAKIPGLGETDFAAGGYEYSIFANHGNHGPVWKMVVALGKKPRAWGVYPGGQSGDPSSPSYDTFLQAWRTGEMKELQFLMSVDEKGARHSHAIQLLPKESQASAGSSAGR